MTRVRDIMQEKVITVGPHASVREIAQTLVRASIGGVPVVDDDGTVLGVVSASDIVRATARDPEVELGFEVARTPPLESDDTEDEDGDEGSSSSFYAPEVIPEWIRPVLLNDHLDDLDASAIMTPATFYVRPELPLAEFADFLVRGRIHRALVLEGGQLVGIATSFDALRALSGGATTAAAAT